MVAVFVLPVVFQLYVGRGMIGCEYIDRDLGRSGLGDRITSREEICDGLGGSVFTELTLAEAHGGNRGVIFSYEPYLGVDHPRDPQPRVTWVSDKIAVIAVDRVDIIHVQHRNLGRDIIRYDIGAIGGRLPFYIKLFDLL